MKEAEYSKMSTGRTGRMPGSPTVLLFGRDSTSMRPEGSHPSLGKGSDLVVLLKSRGRGEDLRIHTYLEFRARLVSDCLLVPLFEGRTVKKEVIRRIKSGRVGG
jgi:hypothetical protein